MTMMFSKEQQEWIDSHFIDKAEVGRDYMPKPKEEKNFGAIADGVTDLAVALGNIAECNAARAAMNQGVTYHDVDVILGSIAAIADAYYMRLPVDADGVPIHVGDDLRSASSKTEYTALGFWFDFDCGIWQVMVSSKQAMSGNMLRHVKPGSLNELLDDVSKGINCYPRERITGYLENNHSIGEAVLLDVRDRLRELMEVDE